jgi:DegV family protein with EDD domain
MAIEILVDSASGITAEEAKARGLLFAPLMVTVGNQTFTEGVDITPDQFYALLGHGDFPKTSQPSPQAYLDRYLEAEEKKDDVLVISLSSKVSGAFQSATLAREMSGYADHIRIVDSLCFFAGSRILLKEALDKRDTLPLEALAEDLEVIVKKIRVYAGMDTLDYVYKGGRLSMFHYALGIFLHAKPIGTLNEGTVVLAGKALGTKNAMKFVIDKLHEDPIDFSYPCYPLYSSDKSILDRFMKEYLLPAFPAAKFMDPLQINPVIGSHIGPLVYGVFYVRTPLPEKKPSLLEKVNDTIREKLQDLKKK